MFKLFQKNSVKIFREADFIDFIEAVRFFTPSDELTRKITERLKTLLERNKPVLEEITPLVEDSEENIDERKSMIAEELFAYLTIKADSRAALSGERLSLAPLFGFGFGKSIGLSNEQDDADLLSDLAGEFSVWIEHTDTFPAGWGEIKFDGDGYIKLLSESEPIPTEYQAEKQAVRLKTRRFKPVQPKTKTAKG